jgi:hypothetical protein
MSCCGKKRNAYPFGQNDGEVDKTTKPKAGIFHKLAQIITQKLPNTNKL